MGPIVVGLELIDHVIGSDKDSPVWLDADYEARMQNLKYDPEASYSKEELHQLIEGEIMKLPARYS